MSVDNNILQESTIDVGDGHMLYVQEWGNPDAEVPIIFLHGGPGGHIKDKHKAVFNPAKHRVILFEQRGCGRSTPFGSLEHNTTDKLIGDITKIADAYRAPKLILHGSSWGSALALAYALAQPERVTGLVVGGVFTGSKTEADWLDQGRFQTFFPDVWQAYLDRTPVEFQDDPSAYHFDKVINGTPEEQKLSGYAYECMESGVVKLDDRQNPEDFDTYNYAGIKIEMYYLSKGCFMPDRHILDNAHKLTMPLHIVQGRYDMVCPPATAYELAKAAPDSHLYWAVSGHMTEHENENIFRTIFALY